MKNKITLIFVMLIVAAMLAVPISAATSNANNLAAEGMVIDAVANAPDVGSTTSINGAIVQASTHLTVAPAAAVDIGLVNRFTNPGVVSVEMTVNEGVALAPDVGIVVGTSINGMVQDDTIAPADVGSIVSINNSTNSAPVNKTVTYGANMARDVGLANSFNNSTNAASAAPDVDIGSIANSISS